LNSIRYIATAKAHHRGREIDCHAKQLA